MTVRKRTAVALVALGAAALPSFAAAADFVTIKFDVSGYARRTVAPESGIPFGREGALNSVIEFVVQAKDYKSFYNVLVGSSSNDYRYAVDTYVGGVSGDTFSVNETTMSFTRGPNRNFSLSACGPFASLTGSFSIAINPLCSTVSFFRGERLGPNSGEGASFEGVVTQMTVTEGYGTPVRLGLLNGPVIALPEPASWAMMIGGFGIVGGILRRRRAKVRLGVC